MSEPEHSHAELDLIRSSLLEAGLERNEKELASLLPWYRVHLESSARIANISLEGTEPQVMFDPRWLS